MAVQSAEKLTCLLHRLEMTALRCGLAAAGAMPSQKIGHTDMRTKRHIAKRSLEIARHCNLPTADVASCGRRPADFSKTSFGPDLADLPDHTKNASQAPVDETLQSRLLELTVVCR